MSTTYAQALLENGFTVIPSNVFDNPEYKRELLDEASNFPEFKSGTKKFVMGSFSALGNPASFHNPTVRKFRQWAHSIVVNKALRGVINSFENSGEWKVEQMMDRMMIRLAGEKPSPESFHRDETTSLIASDDDVILGGWIALGDTQYFSCVPCTHRIRSTKHRGFSKIKKEQAHEFKRRNLVHKVVIPPGSILIFFENIIHEVLPKKFNFTLARLHLAFRLTRSYDIRPADLMEKLDDQGVPIIKSGQRPALHARLHVVNWIEKLSEWSVNNVDERCLKTHTFASGKRAGERWTVCVEHMKSLRDYGMPMYAAYDFNEKRMHTPHRSCMVLAPGCVNTYMNLEL